MYFEFLVMCSVYDVAHFKRRNSRGRDKIYQEKMGEKRSCKYLNAFIVHVMLVGYLTFEIHGLSLSLSLSLSVKAFK